MSNAKEVVLIIQARMGSTRLPGKSMLDLAGAPLLGRIFERLKRCVTLDELVLATTEKSEDDVLVQLASDYGVACFRGSENDLVDRYYQAAKAFDASVVGRFPADNPAPEPEEVDRIVRAHLNADNAFSTNLTPILGNGYPNGIGAEMIDLQALEAVWRECGDSRRREHVSFNFYDYDLDKVVDQERFPVGTVKCPVQFSRPDLVLDVNTEDEYKFLKEIYEYLYPDNPEFHITDIIRWFDDVYSKPRKSS